MFRKLTILTAILSGLYSAASVLDRTNCLESLWAGVIPPVMLERKPTSREKHRMGLQQRIDEAGVGIEDLTRSVHDGESKLTDLRKQLAGQLHGQAIPANRTVEYVRDHPIVAVLLRSVDGQQETLRKAKLKLVIALKNLAKLKAREMALDNGVSMIEPASGPGDVFEAADPSYRSVQERYADILRASGVITEMENEQEPGT
jgi:hypothetical protein